jgi:hypothetical protein
LEQENFSREENSSNYYFEEGLGLERNKEGKENPGNLCQYFLFFFFNAIFVSTVHSANVRNKFISTAFEGVTEITF